MTSADRSERLKNLSPAKRALLLKAMREEAARSQVNRGIPPRGQAGPAPLSFAQQRLWFLDQLEPNTPVFNLPAVIRLSGRLDKAALAESLAEVARRHESLRTTFKAIDGQPVQKIDPTQSLSLTEVDLTATAVGEREALVGRLADEEAERPFDLERGPLLRATLLSVVEQEFVLLFNMHHIISDGWSMAVLVREVAALYGAFAAGRPSPLGPLPIQYADYAVWQRRWLEEEALEGQLRYWKERLSGLPPELNVPTELPRPAIKSYRGAGERLVLSDATAAAARTLALREGATLFMTLLAAFKAVLLRYTQQEDVFVGTIIAGRNRLELESLIGFFVNMLVLRTDLSGNPSFRELLARVKKIVLEAYANQDLPFDKLVEELHPGRDLNRSPLFQIAFALQNTPSQEFELPGVKLKVIENGKSSAKFDLAMEVEEEADRLYVQLKYNSDVFDAATVRRMLDHYRNLLESALADPDRRLWDLQVMSDEERRESVVGRNRTRVEYEDGKCIHELFEAQAEATPDQTAVLFEGGRLSYQELNRRANQLARYLRRLGVGPEVPVGIYVERSPDMVVGLLGILKAGGAYVPLDPAYPNERLAFMISDARMPVLLTQERLVERLPENGVSIIRLDGDRAEIEREGVENLKIKVRPENPAYLIYESGSTVKPKGVLGLHSNTLNRFRWMWQAYPFDRDEVCCQKSSLSSVDSVWEIFGPLLQGIGVVLVPGDAMKEPDRLVAVLGSNKVTRIVLVPSLLRMLLARFGDLGSRLPCLRYCITSGEEIDLGLQGRFAKSCPSALLLNLYGSSEIGADSTWREANGHAHGQRVSIGRPISNTQVYLLDNYHQPVPMGVSGRIYVGGAGLARGYHGRPDLTAERFIPDPFSRDPGARLYKTGDIGRYLASGDIQYLGRSDRQAKIRGFRVELGEIEVLLRKQAGVEDAIVIAKDQPDGLRLVAYVVAVSDDRPAAVDLKARLKEKAPDFMVPSEFVFLDSLPLTPSGKVDRLRLPDPDKAGREPEELYVAPRTQTERALAKIWADVLDIQRVGIHDNFFEIGGHSLLFTRMTLRARSRFQVELSMRQLFQSPNIATIARAVEEELARVGKQPVPEIKRRPRGGKDIESLFALVNNFSNSEARKLLEDQTPELITKADDERQ
jgi:amino acid adenylation domain-containing protein